MNQPPATMPQTTTAAGADAPALHTQTRCDADVAKFLNEQAGVRSIENLAKAIAAKIHETRGLYIEPHVVSLGIFGWIDRCQIEAQRITPTLPGLEEDPHTDIAPATRR